MTIDEKKLQQLRHIAPPEHKPFRVPEGYFDTLQSRVMSSIKQDKQVRATPTKSSVVLHLTWGRLAIAAAFTGCVFLAGITFFHQKDTTTALPSKNMVITSDIEYTDEMLDYTMLSNSEIEYYLTMSD